MKPGFATLFLFLLLLQGIYASGSDRWQQHVSYTMDIDFDVETHRFTGKQKLVYTNNSPDTLYHVFYHLFFNAFQPGSMMDVRSSQPATMDLQIGTRISALGPDEIGYLHISRLECNGRKVEFKEEGTILEVSLKQPILPGSMVTFEMDFNGQVPMQIRRSGRFNEEGIDYSMSQWYPKMCEYDYQGWHADPYIGREFYGVWGAYDVTIRIDHRYIVGATGHLQDPESIGYGYGGIEIPVNKVGKTVWRFTADNIHDFVWAADPDYTHTTHLCADGTRLHFFYVETPENKQPWEQLPKIMEEALDIINARYGKYPYGEYSFIQGGDGGMEYPMATLITGNRPLVSLVGVSVHELLHSWFQMMMGTNELLHAWMDEGFTTYASSETMDELVRRKFIPGEPSDFPSESSYQGYFALAKSGREEPLSTHADHLNMSALYPLSAYNKGAVFLQQLEYVIGPSAWEKGMLAYFNEWKFKHPNPNDFIRVMEKASGLELDWYKEYFVYTSKTIDYGIREASPDGSGTKITLERIGQMPMPIDLVVTDEKGNKEVYNIPLRIMRGEKQPETKRKKDWHVAEDWPWTNPVYELHIPLRFEQIQRIEIDPSLRMADINRENNSYPKPGS